MNYSIQEYIEYRLEEWAKWYLRGNSLGLGYPRASLEGRMMESCGVIAKSTVPPGLLCNAEAEEIEKMVLELNQQNERMAKILRAQYFEQGTTKGKAARLQMSYETFKMQLDLAKQWLTGRLSASYPWRFNCYHATNDLT